MSEKIADKRLKRGVFVKVKSTGRIAVLGQIQEKYNRYHLPSVSGWQYGIEDLEYMDSESVTSELDRITTERDKAIEGLQFYAPYKHYLPPKPFYLPFVVADKGERARTILKELGVDMNE